MVTITATQEAYEKILKQRQALEYKARKAIGLATALDSLLGIKQDIGKGKGNTCEIPAYFCERCKIRFTEGVKIWDEDNEKWVHQCPYCFEEMELRCTRE